jgi:hypothetical protein
MLRSVKVFALVGLVLGCLGLAAVAEEEQKAKYTIKQVMKKAMAPTGDKLCAKVCSGSASDDEKKELVELFTALSLNKPPKGDAATWKAKTTALLEAAKAGDGAKLKAAANCGACHGVHKPKA